MAILIGGVSPTQIPIGGVGATKIMVGGVQVWPPDPPALLRNDKEEK